MIWRSKLWTVLLRVLGKTGVRSSLDRPQWVSRFLFDVEYKAGEWDYLDSCRGDPYARIIQRYAPNARILDLGCGTAKNVELKPGTYVRYLGVDFSQEAIRRARLNARPNTDYEVANILEYEPVGTFDVVLLREVLYYLPTASVGGLLQRLADHLSPQGVIVLQIWDKRVAQPILAETQASGLQVFEEIGQGSQTTVVVGNAATEA
jgi:trans-aconitate methyltransferase